MTVYDLATMKSMNEIATLHALLQSFGISASEGQDFKVEGSTTLRKLGQCVPRLGQGWQLYKRNEGVIRKDDGTCAEVFRCIVGRAALWPYPASVQGDEYQPVYLADLVTEIATPQEVASPLDAFKKFGITAREGETFVVVGDTARDEVAAAFAVAVGDMFKAKHPDAKRWAFVQTTEDTLDAPLSREPKQWRCTASRVSEELISETASQLAERGLAFDEVQAAREPQSAKTGNFGTMEFSASRAATNVGDPVTDSLRSALAARAAYFSEQSVTLAPGRISYLASCAAQPRTSHRKMGLLVLAAAAVVAALV